MLISPTVSHSLSSSIFLSLFLPLYFCPLSFSLFLPASLFVFVTPLPFVISPFLLLLLPLFVPSISISLDPSRYGVEVRPSKAVDELLRRRQHPSFPLQHHSKPKVILLFIPIFMEKYMLLPMEAKERSQCQQSGNFPPFFSFLRV